MTEYTAKPAFLLDPTDEDYSALMSRLHHDAARMRSEVVARHIATVAGALWRAVKWVGVGSYRVFATLMAGVSAREAYLALSRLGDEDLARIGLTREEIPQRISSILDSALSGGGAVTAADLYTVEGGRKERHALPQAEMPTRRAA